MTGSIQAVVRLALVGLLLFLAACGGRQGSGVYSTTAGSAPSTSSASASGQSYTVRSGDTLYGISRQTGVPLRSLIDANGLAPPYELQIGQQLVIPVSRVHVVAKGDTVYGISRRYGVEMAELSRLNGLNEPYTIKVGQQLRLPALASGATEVASAPAPSTPSGSVSSKPLPPPSTSPPSTQPATTPSPAPTSPPAAPAEPAAPATPVPVTPVPATPPASAPSTPPVTAPAPAPSALPAPPARAGGKFSWPVDGKVISTFGAKDGGLHNDGINIAAPRGTPVLAADNGVVAYAGSELRGFGNLLLIKHEGGYVTAYAHNDQLLVKRGDIVRRGQTIARVGSTGSVDTPQLHFEVRKGADAIDPLSELSAKQSAALP